MLTKPTRNMISPGLENVNNTSDADKPVSTAQAAADAAVQAHAIQRSNHTGTQVASTISDFNSAADARIAAQKAQASGLATLGADSKIPSSQLPAIAITDSYVVTSQTAMLALTAQTGDLAIRTDLNKSFVLRGANPTLLADWQELLTPTDTVQSVNGQTGSVTITKADIGLANVTDDAQLKRAAGDINSFTEKVSFADDDIILIEDSAAAFAKKKIKKSNLGIAASGGGGGDVNLMTNGDGANGTTGWTEGSYAAATRPSGAFTASSGAGAFAISTTTTNPLGSGTTSLVLTKSAGASRQGRTIEKTFPLGIDYRAKMLKIDAHYILNSGTFVAGSKDTDSSMIVYASFNVGGTWTPKEPTNFKLLSNSTTISTWMTQTEVQSPHDATEMKLICFVAETANSAWELKATFGVSPSKYVYGSPVTAWQSYTPEYVGIGTPTGVTAKWRQDGSNLEIQWFGTLGTVSAVTAYVTIPSGLTISDSDLSAVHYSVVGQAVPVNTATTFHAISIANDTKIYFSYPNATTNQSLTPQSGSTLFGSNVFLSFTASVPIKGWSSSVAMSSSAGNAKVQAKYRFTTSKTSSGTVPLNFDVMVSDTAGRVTVSPTAWRFTADSEGTYLVNVTQMSAGNTVSTSIFKNGASVEYLYTHPFTAGNGLVSGSTEIDLIADDYIDFRHDANVASSMGYVTISKLSSPQTIAASDTVLVKVTGGPSSVGANAVIIPTNTPEINTSGNYALGRFTARGAGYVKVFGVFRHSTAVDSTLYLWKDGFQADELVGTNDARAKTFHTITWCNDGQILDVRANTGPITYSTFSITFERLK